MKFGVVGSFGSAEQIVEMAVAAEAAGWDGFFSWDGISVGEVDTFDPWVLLGAIAVRTTRIKLGAMVFALARRHPWKVAREAITVDRLSGGRLIMPVGLGAIDDGAFTRVSGAAADRKVRAELVDDALAILDLAWTGETFSYQGTHHSVTDLVFRPRPVSRPRIPIWVVAAFPAPKSMARALRWDGVLPSMLSTPPFEPLTPEDIRRVTAWIGERRGDPAAPYDVVVEGQLPADPAQAAAHVQGLADAGATWWIESHWEGESATPDALLAMIRRGPPGLAQA